MLHMSLPVKRLTTSLLIKVASSLEDTYLAVGNSVLAHLLVQLNVLLLEYSTVCHHYALLSPYTLLAVVESYALADLHALLWNNYH